MSAPKMLSFSKPTPDFNRKFFDLYVQKSMVDVTLSADGQFLHAHKVVLAVASSWFEELFDSLKDKHPVIVVKDLTLDQLTHIMEFIYLGAVNIPEEEAQVFKSTLESFRISIDDPENDEDYQDEEEEEVEEENDTEMEQTHDMDETSQNGETEEQQEQEEQPEQETETGDDFHEKLFELIENDEGSNNKTSEEPEPSEVKIKLEPEWNENLIKEEVIKEEDLLVEQPKKPSPVPKKFTSHIPSSIQLNRPVTVMRASQISQFRPPQTSSIRIRTPASINERLRLNDPITRTVKFIHKIPEHSATSSSSTAELPMKTNIQELSKRLSKAILIRRVRKSDGSIVSERSPIKIVQGMKLPVGMQRTPGTATMHIREKPMQIFRCSHCNKAFSVNKRRNAHEKFCFKNPSRPPSQCPFCPMVLCNPMYISTHIRKVHGIDENGRSIKIDSNGLENETI